MLPFQEKHTSRSSAQTTITSLASDFGGGYWLAWCHGGWLARDVIQVAVRTLSANEIDVSLCRSCNRGIIEDSLIRIGMPDERGMRSNREALTKPRRSPPGPAL